MTTNQWGLQKITKLETLHNIFYDKSYSKEMRKQAEKEMDEIKEQLVQWIKAF